MLEGKWNERYLDDCGVWVLVVTGVVEVFVVAVALTRDRFSYLYRLRVSGFPHVVVVVVAVLARLRMKTRGSVLCLDQSTRTKVGTHTWSAA